MRPPYSKNINNANVKIGQIHYIKSLASNTIYHFDLLKNIKLDIFFYKQSIPLVKT